MQLQDFTYLLQNPQNITTDQISGITSVIEEYPYFQPARALYLKALKNKQSFKYNLELKTTAAYTTDRSILFDYITSDAFNQNEISQIIKQNYEHLKTIEVKDADDISVNKSVTIDDALKQHIKDTEGVLDPNLFEEKFIAKNVEQFISDINDAPKIPIIDIDTDNIEPSPKEQLNIGKPLEFNKTETHSFTEWLKITSFKPIERESSIEVDETNDTQEAAQESTIDKKFELIDKFLSENPKIVPVKDTKPQQNLAQPKPEQNDGLMTETLARIYLEQKNYDKAIQSYKILSLKYPEKSGFFADQIKAVKKLQENNQ
jgi:ribosomal protein S18